MKHHQIFVALLSLSLAACVGELSTGNEGNNNGGNNNGGGGGGGGGGGNDPDAAIPVIENYTLSIANNPINEINLGEQVTWTATIDSENFAGDVTVSLTGAMALWEVSYLPSETITLNEGESTDVTITLTAPTNGAAGAASLGFAVNGDLGSRSATAALTVADRVEFSIPAGTGAGNHSGFGGPQLLLRPGTEVVISNEDSIPHQIHASDHQGGPMANGQSYTLIYENGDRGSQVAYCHIHGEGTGLLNFAVDNFE